MSVKAARHLHEPVCFSDVTATEPIRADYVGSWPIRKKNDSLRTHSQWADLHGANAACFFSVWVEKEIFLSSQTDEMLLKNHQTEEDHSNIQSWDSICVRGGWNFRLGGWALNSWNSLHLYFCFCPLVAGTLSQQHLPSPLTLNLSLTKTLLCDWWQTGGEIVGSKL